MTTLKTGKIDSVVGQHRHEILQVADTVSREKGIDREEVIQAMESALQRIAIGKYGLERDIRVTIHRHTGQVTILNCLTVVETIENESREITFQEATRRNPDDSIKLGDVIAEELPPVEFGRVAAQNARQVIMQKVREAERARQYLEFKDRIGDIVSGIVKRVEFGNIFIDLGGRGEAILRREEIIPREIFHAGDRIKAYVLSVSPDAKGPMIALSRVHPQFMAKLFAQEVPEIYDGIIDIKSVARDPGSRAKIAVFSADPSLDPIGACVGMRGARVQAVVSELQGEKVDIIPWSSNAATFVVNALAPAEVTKVVLDEEKKRVEAIVAEDHLSLAIGRRGQNVRLASQLTGWDIDILTEAQESEKRAEEYSTSVNLFMEALDVDEIIAQLLTAEGFSSVDQIIEADVSELVAIEGFDEDIAQELKNRATNYQEKKLQEDLKVIKEKGLDPKIQEIKEFTSAMLLQLVEKEVKTLDDLADLSGDELIEILGNKSFSLETANKIIMGAREHWFAEDK